MNSPEIKNTIGGKMMKVSVVENGTLVKEYDYGDGHANTIMDTGLNYLLKGTAAGTANEKSGYVFGGYTSTTYRGVLRGCQRGSGSSENNVSMTSLESSIGNITTTVLAGDPNTGTRYDRENATIYMRVTHDHEIETTDQNINEIGYFGVRGSVQFMFSRIVLPSTVTVLAGQQIRTTYELAIQISPTVVTASESNLITGWDTTGTYRFSGYMPATSTTYGSLSNSFISVIDTSCDQVLCYGEGNFSDTFPPRNTLLAYTNTSYLAVIYKTDTCDFSSEWHSSGSNLTGNSFVYGTLGTTLTNGNSTGTATIASSAYIDGTFYRDITVILNANWPGSNINIYGIHLFGLKYKFDTPQTKSNIQKLTLSYRISFARA